MIPYVIKLSNMKKKLECTNSSSVSQLILTDTYVKLSNNPTNTLNDSITVKAWIGIYHRKYLSYQILLLILFSLWSHYQFTWKCRVLKLPYHILVNRRKKEAFRNLWFYVFLPIKVIQEINATIRKDPIPLFTTNSSHFSQLDLHWSNIDLTFES